MFNVFLKGQRVILRLRVKLRLRNDIIRFINVIQGLFQVYSGFRGSGN